MTLAGAGASEPLYFNDEGQPVYTYMVSVPHANKHLIRFPISLEPMSLRRKGTHTDSSLSTPHVLLKADTGADVNLINRRTFNQLFDSKVLTPTPIKMENYGNSTVKVLGMFHAFLRWKEKVYKQLFYVTDCDRSPNLLSRDACYTLGVLKPCYTVERAPGASQMQNHENHEWRQNRHVGQMHQNCCISIEPQMAGNCLTLPGNSQFPRIS